MRHNYSKQRSIILQSIQELSLKTKHLNLEDIFKHAKKRIPNLSLATVYRNLHVLEDDQHIQRLQINKDIILFEIFAGPHHHFICEHCNNITHLTDPNFKICSSCIEQTNQFTINKIYTTIFGICNKCK